MAARQGAATMLLSIVDNARGDDLARAEMAFRNLSPEEMQQEYGVSGETCQEILDSYRRSDARWQEAKSLLMSLLEGGRP